jgi:hypothetical protein
MSAEIDVPAESPDNDPEFRAMRLVYNALRGLDSEGQRRVLDYVLRRLGQSTANDRGNNAGMTFSPRELAEETKAGTATVQDDTATDADEDLVGVSAVALKWIRRNGLVAEQLSKVFSLGLDEIDLVAQSVPGKNKKEKMRSVLLLSGAAAYLGTGAPRAEDTKVREALGHYNAYDTTNFATYMRDFAPEVSGTKATGYTLTARGLAAAAEVIKSMTASEARTTK